MATSPAFSWWSPTSSGGQVAFGFILGLSALTFFMGAGPSAIINIGFWYVVCVLIRVGYLRATGKHANAEPKSDVTNEQEHRK